jgi:hypothetical protein
MGHAITNSPLYPLVPALLTTLLIVSTVKPIKQQQVRRPGGGSGTEKQAARVFWPA